MSTYSQSFVPRNETIGDSFQAVATQLYRDLNNANLENKPADEPSYEQESSSSK